MRDLWFSFKLKLLLFSTRYFICWLFFHVASLSLSMLVVQSLGSVNLSDDHMVNNSNNLLTYLNKDLVLVLTVTINTQCACVYLEVI